MKCFLVRLFQNVPSWRKAQIADELSVNPDFNNIWEFSDSFYDYMLTSYNDITDIDALRSQLEGYAEVEEIKEADSARQVLVSVLVQALQLLHPFMPFITEEIYSALAGHPGFHHGAEVAAVRAEPALCRRGTGLPEGDGPD